LVFEKNAIFCRKLSKIAENCDHNIDPWFRSGFEEIMLQAWKQKKIAILKFQLAVGILN
jgi:hypothetical protein